MGASTEEATALRPYPYAHKTLSVAGRNSLYNYTRGNGCAPPNISADPLGRTELPIQDTRGDGSPPPNISADPLGRTAILKTLLVLARWMSLRPNSGTNSFGFTVVRCRTI